jgi:hypothetical protein
MSGFSKRQFAFRSSRFLLLAGILGLGTFAGSVALQGQEVVSEMGPALKGHEFTVSSADYSPDGSLVATGSFDRTVRIWKAEDTSLLRTLSGHTGQVLALDVSPDGRQLVTASRDATVKLWDVFRPDPLAQFTGHTEAIGAIAISSDGSWIVSGSADKAAKVWQVAATADTEAGKVLLELAGHVEAVASVAIRKDDALIATADAAGIPIVEPRRWQSSRSAGGSHWVGAGTGISPGGRNAAVRRGRWIDQAVEVADHRAHLVGRACDASQSSRRRSGWIDCCFRRPGRQRPCL